MNLLRITLCLILLTVTAYADLNGGKLFHGRSSVFVSGNGTLPACGGEEGVRARAQAIANAQSQCYAYYENSEVSAIVECPILNIVDESYSSMLCNIRATVRSKIPTQN